MKTALVVLVLLCCPLAARAQVEQAEMTTLWQETREILTADGGDPLPPDTDVGSSLYLGRLRLQDRRRFPLYEIRYAFADSRLGADLRDLRLAALQRLPWDGFAAKGIYVEQNPAGDAPSRFAALYLTGAVAGVQFSAGLDHADRPQADASLWSLRAKYRSGRLTLLAGGSSQTDDLPANEQERWLGGAVVELPGQFLVGGLFGSWDRDEGFAANVGRYNRLGDYGGAPSFSLNYIEVPTLYKWTNFRVMWGDAGIHYVPPTFSSDVFSGQYDIDMGLMLNELVPENYRHFDSPLLFKRYDEYGKLALRVNFIETPSSFRKFDANLSVNRAVSAGPIRSLRGILSAERLHNPVFGWQDLRWHLTGAVTLLDALYAGLTWSRDFAEYDALTVELRTQVPLPFSSGPR